jgi:hypothetical protein
MRLTLIIATLALLASCTPTQRAPEVATPAALPAPRPTDTSDPAEVLILGDSQISFGAGQAYRAFFGNLAASCAGLPRPFATARAMAIGVRSSALHHWTTKDPRARGVICDVDEKFGVNAGSYGVTSPGLSYVQIGADAAYPFCPADRPSLSAVFDAPGFDPDLVILGFLGNATQRWQSASTARADWQAAEQQIPAGTACIAMTTIPSFEAGENQRRSAAQTNLAQAVNASGRCAFVPGFTPATLAEFEGNTSHFRTNADGAVTDPRHPTASSAATFVALQTPAFCAAISQVLRP